MSRPSLESSGRRQELIDALRVIEKHGDSSGWVGPDPYEGLNATRFVGPLQRSAMGRRILIQLVKRSPLDLRPILGISPRPNSTTAAWSLSAYALGGFLPQAEEEYKTELAVQRLLSLRAPQFSDNAWGYLFPTQSRVFFYGHRAPNTVGTVWAAHALLDAHERLDRPELIQEADSTCRFLLEHVPQTEDAPGAYFGYLVDDRSPIHNSSLHACALLARVSTLTGNDAYMAAATRGVEWSLARQRPDGSWPYGERPNLQWVDGFHTGYVLDALGTCRDAGMAGDIQSAWLRGLAYYREHLFLEDGTPRYYSNETYPIDATCVAQGIQTLALASAHDPSCLDQAWQVFGWALRNMRRRDGLFMFQRRRHWSNRVPHMRWAQATMMLAMAHLLLAEQRREASAPALDREAA
jgi:hypothetical protein